MMMMVRDYDQFHTYNPFIKPFGQEPFKNTQRKFCFLKSLYSLFGNTLLRQKSAFMEIFKESTNHTFDFICIMRDLYSNIYLQNSRNL